MLRYWLWLTSLSRLNNQIRLVLPHRFATPEEVFLAGEEELRQVEGLSGEQIAEILLHDLSEADRILDDCQRLNQRVLTIQDAEYPNRLRNIYDPPCLLYVKGRLPVVDEEAAVAVVGTRKSTPYGISCAGRLAFDLASCGAPVVTGLARGGDTAAAVGALRAGGTVIGVTGNGLDYIYPPENQRLYEDVAAAGALLSEYPPGTEPNPRHFPVRNRILSGLSVAVLVVEAPVRSGTLITARLALEQGRDVFAVPGPIDAPSSAGCLELLEEGAGVGAKAWHILREYEARFPDKLHPAGRSRRSPDPIPARPKPAPAPVKTREKPPAPEEAPGTGEEPALIKVTAERLTDDQIALLGILEVRTPKQIDDLIQQSGIPTRRVLSALTVMEIDGLVRQHSGKRYTRMAVLADA